MEKQSSKKKYLIFLLFVIAIGAGGFFGFKQINAHEEKKANAKVSFAELTKEMKNMELKQDKDIKNVLVVGTDKRNGNKANGRSDLMMIVGVDSKNEQLKVTSLMRDTYVDIPGYGKNRLNQAYAFGGVSLLYQTIAQNYGVQLDGYAILDFEGFKKMIDQLGGVKIQLTDWEADYMQRHYVHSSAGEVKQGLRQLNGEQTLAYCRIRQDGAGDYGRIERQMKVVTSLHDQFKTMNVTNLVNMNNSLFDCVKTDLQVTEIKTMMAEVLKIGVGSIEKKNIPAEGQFNVEKVDGMSVIVPDIEQSKASLQDFMFNPVLKTISLDGEN